MDEIRETIHVSESIGDVSAVSLIPGNTWCFTTLAHGAGAGMEHSFMKELSAAFASHGVATLCFNFPFIEAKKRRPDFPAVAEKTIAAALDHAAGLAGAWPLFASGKSFGGRMTSQHLAKKNDDRVRGIVFFGFPLHAANVPAIGRAEHLSAVLQPMLFLQGTNDALARIDLIGQVCSALDRAELQTFEGFDHGFMRSKKGIVPELATTAAHWFHRVCVSITPKRG